MYTVFPRSGMTDAIYRLTPTTGWTLDVALPGTDKTYCMVTWKNKILIADNLTAVQQFDPVAKTLTVLTDAPVVQYLAIHQDRIMAGGGTTHPTRVLWSEVLEENKWSPNNFLDAQAGHGGQITALLGTPWISRDPRFFIFKEGATLSYEGTVNEATSRLVVVSTRRGCRSPKTIWWTPYGAIFLAQDKTVQMIGTGAGELQDIGYMLKDSLSTINADEITNAAAFYHNDLYRLSIAGNLASTNVHEWLLDLRPQVFPKEINWYGPGTGDFIGAYAFYRDLLLAREVGNMKVWEIDRAEDKFKGMDGLTRVSTATPHKLAVPNDKATLLEAYGFNGDVESGITFTVVANDGETTNIKTISGNTTREVIRPSARIRGHVFQVTATHSANEECLLESFFLRAKPIRRQAE